MHRSNNASRRADQRPVVRLTLTGSYYNLYWRPCDRGQLPGGTNWDEGTYGTIVPIVHSIPAPLMNVFGGPGAEMHNLFVQDDFL
jgi:hypothetical protein